MENKFNVLIESYKFSKESKEGVTVTGTALPFGKTSRNGFTYVTESIKKAYPTLEKAPVLFNHDTNKVLGHVKSLKITESGLDYEMDLDPDEPIVKKLRRGDIRKVSIQCLYDEKESFIDESGVTHAYISEFLELSVVTIPGFADTSAQVVEMLKDKKETKSSEEKSHKNNRGKEQMDDEQKPKEEQEESPLDVIMRKVEAGEELSDEEKKMLSAAIDAAKNGEEKKEEVDEEEPKSEEEETPEESKMDQVIKMLSHVVDLLNNGNTEESAEEEPKKEKEKPKAEEQEDPEEDEKKREEALKNNKMTSSEAYKKQDKVVTLSEIKEAFKAL